jgi:hypothetical protein
MHRARRRVTGEPAPDVEPTGIDPLAQLVEENAQSMRVAHLAHKTENDDEED